MYIEKKVYFCSRRSKSPMTHRLIADIFPAYYLEKVDEEEIQRKCNNHLDAAQMPEDVYKWIEKEDCPYMREAYAESTWQKLDERRVDPYEQQLCAIRTYLLEEIYDHLKHIIRQAQSEQLTDQLLACDAMEPIVANHHNQVPQLQQIQVQLDYLKKEVEQLKTDKIIAPNHALIAACYTAKATNDDKCVIEDFLRRICAKKDKSMTAQLKKYLRLKQTDGLLVLPIQLQDEYDIVCQFGYNYTLKTYKNCPL